MSDCPPPVFNRRTMILASWLAAMEAELANSASAQPTKFEGYSVDRRNIYEVGKTLELLKSDPLARSWVDEQPVGEDLNTFIATLFPDGMSRHGWDYTMAAADWLTHNQTGEPYILYLPQIEIVFELVRQATFPKRPSRLQSFFAWEQLAEAEAFRQPG